MENRYQMIFIIFLFFLVFIVNTQTVVIPQDEIQALKNFYNTFGGANWYRSDNWNTDSTLCTDFGWYGVLCWVDQETVYHVFLLQMTNNNLVGLFHTFQDWGSWPYLQSLFIDHNSIGGSIPSSFWSLSNIQQIHMTSNNLVGSISSSFSNFKQLTELQLDYNSFTGTIPAETFELPYLSRLMLTANSLTGSLTINTDGSQFNLTYLDIGQCNLVGSIPSMLYTFTALQYLVLSGVSTSTLGLTGVILPDIGNLNLLEYLDMSSNKLTGTIPPEMMSLPNMKELFLYQNQLTGVIPDTFQNMPQLEQLSLDGNSLTGTLPSSIYQCTELNLLDLGLNMLNGTISSDIINLQNLQTLNLKGMPPPLTGKITTFSGVIPSQLWKLSNLHYLFLSFNRLQGSFSDTIGDDMPLLQTISAEMNNLNGTLPDSFYKLKYLNFLYLYSNQLTGKLSYKIENLNISNMDLHNNVFQGFVPNFFSVSHNLVQPGTSLSGNSFLCPVSKGAQTIYGATCKNVLMSSFQAPTKIFNEIVNNITILGTNYPWSLQDEVICNLGTSSDSTEGDVIYMDTHQTTCQFGSNSLEGYQILSLHYNGTSIASIFLNTSAGLLVYGRPDLTSMFPSAWREQGDSVQLITVTGSGFIPTDNLTCLFINEYNSTVRPATYIDYTTVSCPIPPYFHSPIIFNATVDFFVSNDGTYYNVNPLPFLYFPFCYGNPACGGENKGTCIPGAIGERPHCLCRTTGFDNSTYCFTCLPLHYGPNCLSCPDCHSGNCNEGYDGDGLCKCNNLYMGSECQLFWLSFVVPIVIIVILFPIIGVVVYKLCNRKDKTLLPEKKEEEDNEYHYKEGI